MQPNGDLRPVTRSQTNPDRGKPRNTVARANTNGKKKLKATRIENSAVFSSGRGNSGHAQSTTLSSGSNHSAGENTAPPLLPEGPDDSDDPLNALRSKRRELALQADDALHDNCRIHVRSDSYSCMEIKDILESLNCDIMQLAALISDKLKFKHAHVKTLDGLAELYDAANNVQAILGRRVTELLIRRITKDMQSIVVQAVVQSVLAKTCRRLIQCWSISYEEHTFFVTSYKKFRKTSSFETTAQWRAATRGIVKYGPQSDTTRDFALGELINNLLDVLRIAGWKNSAPKENIQRMFGVRIRELIELTIKVDRAIMEGALSQDLHLFMPGHDDIYDPSMMVDINQGPSAVVSDEKVAVCVNIGLKLGEKRKDKGDTKDLEASASGPKVLLKGNVVLDAALGI
ncbi:uncharacterized protein ARMOST_17505 [Armillaria ostoyae]|uniref:Uncharacterized protein n=1 Tax=Armillaria ostoyae TaxID=47428 RepID=A0A284RZ65_ARMOS|nr:uncharacterized protein ARMOST_17505 [Armillaria ostoyae]